MKIDKQNITFDGTEIENHKFHKHKNPNLIYDVDINKNIVFNKISCDKIGFKYCVVYKDNKKLNHYG